MLWNHLGYSRKLSANAEGAVQHLMFLISDTLLHPAHRDIDLEKFSILINLKVPVFLPGTRLKPRI